jgi:hypothetical protein
MPALRLSKNEWELLRQTAKRRWVLNYIYQPIASAVMGVGLACLLWKGHDPRVGQWVGLVGSMLCGIALAWLGLVFWERRSDFARAKAIVEKGLSEK